MIFFRGLPTVTRKLFSGSVSLEAILGSLLRLHVVQRLLFVHARPDSKQLLYPQAWSFQPRPGPRRNEISGRLIVWWFGLVIFKDLSWTLYLYRNQEHQQVRPTGEVQGAVDGKLARHTQPFAPWASELISWLDPRQIWGLCLPHEVRKSTRGDESGCIVRRGVEDEKTQAG